MVSYATQLIRRLRRATHLSQVLNVEAGLLRITVRSKVCHVYFDPRNPLYHMRKTTSQLAILPCILHSSIHLSRSHISSRASTRGQVIFSSFAYGFLVPAPFWSQCSSTCLEGNGKSIARSCSTSRRNKLDVVVADRENLQQCSVI